jgi:hypothetical protein
MKINPYLSPCAKLNPKDLNIRPDTLNLIEEKMRSKLELIDTGEDFLNRTLSAQPLRPTINKWNLVNRKASVKQRATLLEQSGRLENGKRHLLGMHPIEG